MNTWRPPRELHPRLCEQLAQARLAAAGSLELTQLLPLISAYYEQIDDERRGIVRSMQLIADEARSFGDGPGGGRCRPSAGDTRHIKDVVITVGVDGSIKIFNPTGERVFGYSRSEIIGQPIARLLPELRAGSVEQGSASRLPRRVEMDRGDLRPREFNARHKDGHLFPAELIASRVRIEHREVYVICLRDTSERVRAEQALRDSEARYRTLVESAPELIVAAGPRSPGTMSMPTRTRCASSASAASACRSSRRWICRHRCRRTAPGLRSCSPAAAHARPPASRRYSNGCIGTRAATRSKPRCV